LLRSWLASAALLAGATPALGFEFFDGRLQIHGFAAQQIRAVGRDLDPSDDIDLAQWYSVLGLEIEGNLAPDGFGPFEIIESFIRLEARYDCIWTQGCEMFPSVNVYGNRAHHFPKRYIDGRLAGFSGALRSGDTRRFVEIDRKNYELWHRDDPQNDSRRPLTMQSLPGFLTVFGAGDGPNDQFEPIRRNFGDDPPPFYFFRFLNDCLFGAKKIRGGENGMSTQILGPWNPGCHIDEIGALAGKPNPINFRDFNPILAGLDRTPFTADDLANPNSNAPDTEEIACAGGILAPEPGLRLITPCGRGALPFRPAPLYDNDDRSVSSHEARGLYYPSLGLRRALKSGDLDNINQNFTQRELSWNRGASQQDEYELKEAYLDLEAAAGRLWMRLGKQTIVWGKTELFRNTDQFNPQDLALASLPGLEESRIALWAVRGTWSFYNIGKIEDVRLEVAANFDDFEPADLGRCGEPFAFDQVCNLTFGYFAHGIAGAGLAGNATPPNPWDDPEGIEVGARVEFRYRRFSFQISDFYGYDDFPYAKRIQTFERNVDPMTGMPRRTGANGPCTTGDSRIEPACLARPDAIARVGGDDNDPQAAPLRARDWDRNGIPDDVDGDGTPDILAPGDPGILGIAYKTGELIVDRSFRAEVLKFHPANQTAFAFGSILCGAAGLNVDPALCSFGSFNGKEGPVPYISTVAEGASGVLAGSLAAYNAAVGQNFVPDFGSENLVQLNQSPGDDSGVFSDGGSGPWSFAPPPGGGTLGQGLTPYQEALLGCGPFFLADCDDDGIDMLNAEASVLIQSWPGFDGTTGSVDSWRVDVGLQPGTAGFTGGAIATRPMAGLPVILPGARSQYDDINRNGILDLFDPAIPPQFRYDPARDGCTEPVTGTANDAICAGANPILHPFTGAVFRTELAAISWNLMMTFMSRSDPRDPANPALSEFAENDANGDLFIDAGFPGAGTIQLRPGVSPKVVPVLDNPVACGLLKPQLCENVRNFLLAAGAGRNLVRAGGNGDFGRRDFAWHSSGELVLHYEKRNIFGVAFDFAEDRSKTNWGVEATWVESQPFFDNNEFDNITRSDTLNVTISADRPTFVNFLNPNRTFLFNTQWFFQYITNYEGSFLSQGPFNALATFTIFTGYHQDRLLLFYTGVYDFGSSSGGVLPQLIYRFTENFSATIGMNFFFGRQEYVDSAVSELRAGLNRTGRHAYKDAVENGLSPLRERDEIYTTLRYTF
jgi:hypothetical protein